MGTRTMGSRGSSGGNGGIQHPKSDGCLTLDEVQHRLGDLGKPLNSMNLDEFLKNVWTAEAEANQGMSSGPGQLDYPQHTHHASASSMARQSSYTQHASASSMARQSSIGDLINKTVDELWQDIQQGQTKMIDDGGSNDSKSGGGFNVDRKTVQEKQLTPGEMTLEDFLAKEGIDVESSQEKKLSASDVGAESIALSQQNINPQQAQWMQYQTPPSQHQQHMFVPGHHQVQQPLPSSATITMDAASSETKVVMSPSPLMGTLSDTQAPGRKRNASGDMMEKTVERRQKRMIKNRESAARSRARKQAYTHELENKVSRLEEENERLKREQEAENILPSVPPPEPKYQLRRTSSALY